MDRQKAEQKLKECIADLPSQYLPKNWPVETFQLSELANGDWLASPPGSTREGVILRSGEVGVPFFGALGQLVQVLGYPLHPERLLGSAQRGRYQSFERGLAVWEEFPQALGINVGHPVALWGSPDERSRKCTALVAFFDLRGFTTWSRTAEAPQIQAVVEDLEAQFQRAFSGSWSEKLFAKGTGDGFMVVSEQGWYSGGGPTDGAALQRGHARQFCSSCAQTILSVRRAMADRGLVVGCGITMGEIARLYVLGRVDYSGPAVNDASKIQAVAYDEICVAPPVLEALRTDGVRAQGKPLPDKGERMSAEDLRAATA